MPEKARRTAAYAATAAVIAAATFLPAAASADTTAPGAPGTPGSQAQPRIVGGGKASVDDYPYTVYLADSNGNQFCGAVLVDRSAVATAAHCAKAFPQSELRVVAGRDDKRTSVGAVSTVSGVWIDPGFRDAGQGNDIAVLNLPWALPFEPAKLPSSSDRSLYDEGTKATVLGWGRIADNGARSDYLRSAVVPVVSDRSCAGSYSNYDPKSMVCAGYPQGGIDACQGDSGGPLVVGDTLIGIVSYGEGCAEPNKPGVYTRVSSFVDEIEKHIR
ncbi:S1 family peptidase [Amycolatopsis sp. CA-230715]|uniref:S1 family peptidase n=1 Tax=Amycolatopsis sp. CA-230715 TaxID=2745196 RepID=UPI001C01DAC0|nr:serine protease [Amycolatopsis sp. CA-230715]QWF83050.1 Trypsin [Amycolatopsis sp. CA-230715]